MAVTGLMSGVGIPGQTPIDDGQAFQDQVLNRLRGLKTKAGEVASNLGPQAEAVRKGYMKKPGVYSTIAATAGTSALQALGGDPLGAITSIPGTLAGGGAGSLLANFVPGVGKPIAKAIFPLIGAAIGGSATEEAARAGLNYLGAKIPGSEEVAVKSKEERDRDFIREQARKDIQTQSQADLARDLEYAKVMMPLSLEYEKSLIPIREQLMRTQLVNQQALNASNAALYQQMGRSATMGKYVLGAQEGANRITGTLLSQNPYTGSVLQAPQISFG